MVSTAGAIVIAIVVLLIAAAVGYVVFTQLRARRLGQPPPPLSSYIPFYHPQTPYGPPQPATGGPIGWVNDQIRKFKNRNNRSAAGAYEPSGPGGPSGGRRGFGPLDPDEAWDTRVGNEADYGYYEETELGHTGAGHGSTEYHGGMGREDNPYMNTNLGASPYEPESRDRGGGGGGGGGGGSRNPFDDDNATSLRGVSPQPIDTEAGRRTPKAKGDPDSADSSPAERRSVFRENV